MSNDTPSQSEIVITVRALRAVHEGAEIQVQLLIENGEHREQKSLLLTMEQYCELKPQKGVISEDVYEKLEAASELCRAIRAGEQLLSYGQNSVQMLTAKLLRRGYSRAYATAAAEHLAARGLIDEEGDVRREVERSVAKLWGRKRIRAHLWNRGFEAESMRQVDLLFEEFDFVENCATLIKKHFGDIPTDVAERKRMLSYLCRYGYSVGEVREAIALLSKKEQ